MTIENFVLRYWFIIIIVVPILIFLIADILRTRGFRNYRQALRKSNESSKD